MKKDGQPIQHPGVQARFDAYPPAARERMMALRELVLRTAASTPGVGEMEETLKWGEPAYVTVCGSGSTVRMDWKASQPNEYALYFHCQTTLVDTFRSLFPGTFRFDGHRAVVLALDTDLPVDELTVCIEAALTYHLKKKSRT
ncbi:DUF1801 domain-containing protein [Hydrogenophaga sp. 5NK40-0174]|uniref:DUF1801 domain-containing protein n=1 Tax=Hydrogenophaga sp. 5NK40-0174 TaxID=3127649 RepID=UPI00334282C5